jgi:hypothetical protein
MNRIICAQLLAAAALSSVLNLAAPQLFPTTRIPQTQRWDKSGVPLKILSVPQLTLVSTFKLQDIQPDGPQVIQNVVVLDNVFVVLTRYVPPGEQRPHYRLRSFDANTGKPLSSVDVAFAGAQFIAEPNIYASSRESVVLEFAGSLLEYDEHLKLRGKINLPKGSGVEQAPAYGYGDWSAVTATKCKEPIAVFRLNSENELITGCGSEMGLLDRDGKLRFAERYKDDRIDGLQISADGKRFLFSVFDPFTGGDPPPPPWKNPPEYVLYDLNGEGPRRISFSTASTKDIYLDALSADGKVLALHRADTISLYRLPE